MSCEVCLMEANGLHFGISTCRACAAFFRRSVALQLSFRCQKESNCDVTKKQRFCCRYCRFEKCKAKGMRSGLVNYAAQTESQLQSELSTPPSSSQNIAPVSPQESMASSSDSQRSTSQVPNMEDQSSPSSSCSMPSPAEYSESQERLKQRIDQLFERKESLQRLDLPIRLTISQQVTMALNEHSKKWPLCAPDKVRKAKSFDLYHGVMMRMEECENIAGFCMCLQDFAKLPKDQKWILFKTFWPKFVPLERHLTLSKIVDNIIPSLYLSYDGQLYDLRDNADNDTVLANSGPEARQLFEIMQASCEGRMSLLGNQLIKIHPTLFELTFCLLQVLWGVRAGNGITAETVAIAENVRHRLSEEVHNYYAFEEGKADYAGRVMKLMNVVSAVDEVDQQTKEDTTLFRTFDVFKLDIMVSDLTTYA